VASSASTASAGAREAASAPTVARGALLCEAFEAYTALMGESQISFEHAVFLLSALLAGGRAASRPLPGLHGHAGH
jgi:hypothetical protein